jgi:hypothetical protein
MVWDIQVRRSYRHHEQVFHVKARWTGFGPIDDVCLDGADGVQDVGHGPTFRRRMSVLSRALEGDFRWDGDTVRPEVVITWTDGGELGEQRIPLNPVEPDRHVLSRFRLADRRR